MSDDLRFTSTVVGDVELKQRFADLNDGVRVALRKTLTMIGQTLRDAEDAEAPRKTGALGGTTTATLSETGATMTETVRPRKFYARFIVGGVVNHGTAGNKRSLAGNLRKIGVRRGLVERVRELRSQGRWRIQPNNYIERAWTPLQGPAQAEIEAALAEAVKAG